MDVKRVIGTAPWLLSIGLAGSAALTAGGLLQSGTEVLSQLRIPETRAHKEVLSALWEGTPTVPNGADVFTAASPDKRAAIVRGLGSFVKAYTRTSEFKAQYAQYRADNAPRKSSDSASDDPEQSMKSAIAEAQANLKKASSAEERAILQQSIAIMQEQLKMLSSPQMKAMMEAGSKQAQEEGAKRYAEDLKEYERTHPKDPDVLVARRLKEFLDLSATVDFTAKVAKSGGMMRFTDPKYESKSNEWKMCYRAGKEAIDAARAFATEWLRELTPKT